MPTLSDLWNSSQNSGQPQPQQGGGQSQINPEEIVQMLMSLGDPNAIMQIAKAAIQMLQQGGGGQQQGGQMMPGG